ncbi:hypothetical protein [Sphingopyxis sp.]|nr:hypothetical protein [Sphingopyxis sp.]HJS09979.1 hypothetical protein [Sphingopyxis sp.]
MSEADAALMGASLTVSEPGDAAGAALAMIPRARAEWESAMPAGMPQPAE